MPEINTPESLKYQEKLAHYLRTVRVSKNWTREQLADKLEVSYSAVARLEGQEPYPRLLSLLNFLKQFADLEEISLTRMLSYLEDGGLSTGDEVAWKDQLVKSFSTLRAHLQFRVLEHLKAEQKTTIEKAIGFALDLADIANEFEKIGTKNFAFDAIEIQIEAFKAQVEYLKIQQNALKNHPPLKGQPVSKRESHASSYNR